MSPRNASLAPRCAFAIRTSYPPWRAMAARGPSMRTPASAGSAAMRLRGRDMRMIPTGRVHAFCNSSGADFAQGPDRRLPPAVL
jgi:hypothetical protein